DRRHRLARDHRGTRPVPGELRRHLPHRSGGDGPMSTIEERAAGTGADEAATDRGEAMSGGERSPSPRGVLAAAGYTVGTLAGRLLGVLGRGLDRGIERAEYWLVDAKHARYGLAITRILLGATALGLLA